MNENKIIVYIDGINRTKNVVFPLKYGEFLDERLDECLLTLRGIDEETFSPLTPVEIVLRNEEYWYNGKTEQKTVEEIVKYYFVADDSSEEYLPGQDVYSHELSLIEVTKLAECRVCDSLTYTNSLGRTYTKDTSFAQPEWE